jgi:hypothetical protein
MGDQGATVVQVNGNDGQSTRYREEGNPRQMEAGPSYEAPRAKSFDSASRQPSGKKP